ncbi:MAG: Asp23/Gls24 family envelope stress response protein [Anaerolineae bacterium]
MDEKLGKVTIAPDVLVTIVQKTSMSEPGVAQLCDNVPGVKRLLGIHTVSRGVGVSVEGNSVAVNVYLVARRGVDLLEMGRNLQHEITRAMQDIVGMQVREVNIHIDDIATELSAEAPDKKARTG